MKKNSIIKLFFIFIILLVPVIILSAAIGDVDGNGKVGASDYLLIRKHILGTSKLTGDKLTRADVNSDGKVNSTDYILIRKAIINGTSITTPTSNSNKEDMEAYFLNTYNRSGFSETFSGNDAFIFKTTNGKYVLIDTGIKSNDIKKVIYNELKSLQGKSTVTIDYMIISHMHNDHYGNAVDIMNDSKINIKKLILKREKYSSKDETLVSTAKKNNIDIIETDSLKEGAYYTLSDNIKMYLFNVKDIYTSSDNCDVTDYVAAFTSNVDTSSAFAKSTYDKYIYFEGTDFLNNGNKAKISTTSKIENKVGSDYKIKGRFYMTMVNIDDKRSVCSSNANSLAVLFQVKTTKGNKYMYVPSDLENNGYNPLGEYDSTYKTTIHGYAATYFYDYKVDGDKVKFIVKDNQLVKSTKVKVVRKASSYTTALNMKNKFSDLVGNIVVYQSAHHGLNTYKEVVDVLKLNNKAVNVITPVSSNPINNKTFATSLSTYNLRNANIMYDGGSSKKGTKCTIKANGTTTCAYY